MKHGVGRGLIQRAFPGASSGDGSRQADRPGGLKIKNLVADAEDGRGIDVAVFSLFELTTPILTPAAARLANIYFPVRVLRRSARRTQSGRELRSRR